MPVWEAAKMKVQKDCVCGFLWFVADKKNKKKYQEKKRMGVANHRNTSEETSSC